MPGPLAHVRVLDLSRVLAGPWATQQLADLGAEVIKVERPGRGDDTRSWGPPYLKDRRGLDTSEAAYYLCCNRGKMSLTLDISKPEGGRIVKALAARSDILIENYKVGGLKKYGLAYEDLRETHPHLIYCSITGFGQTGPYRDRAGYDFMIQGMGGLMSITGERDDRPGGGPQKVGVAVADLVTGFFAAVAVLAALAHRERTGCGQHIDLALLDCQVALLSVMAMNYLTTGKAPGRYGNAHANIVPYHVFQTADEPIIVAVGNDAQFATFCALAGRPELARSPDFATNPARVKNRDRLVPVVEEILRERPARSWLEALGAAGIPSGPINDLDRVFADPQVQARGMRIELPHRLAGQVPLVKNPTNFSLTAPEYRLPPPLLGEHTEEVLKGLLGLEEAEVARLRAEGVI